MIIEAIITELATRIGQTGFISQSGGMAQEVKRTVNGALKIDLQAHVYPFVTGKAVNISPDAKESGIAFWSVGPTRIVNQNAWVSSWENDVILTGWINGNRIASGQCADAEFAVIQAVKGSRFVPGEGSPLRAVTIDFTGDNQGQAVGSRYGWDDAQFQYGAAPYRLFEHRFRLTYFVGNGCCTAPVEVLQPAC